MSKVNPDIFLFLFYFQYILQRLLSVTRIYLYVILFSFQTFFVIQKEPLNHFVFFLAYMVKFCQENGQNKLTISKMKDIFASQISAHKKGKNNKYEL